MPVGGVFAQKQQGAPERSAAGETIQPCHRVGSGGAGLEALHHFLQMWCPQRALVDGRAGDAPQIDGGIDDDAGQAHAAAGGVEQRAVLGARTVPHRAIGLQQTQRVHMLAKGAVEMMILAVHIAGDGAAHADETSAWHHGQEPATGREAMQDGVETDTGSAGQQTGVGVERKQVIQLAGLHDGARQRAVAVAASQSAGDAVEGGRCAGVIRLSIQQEPPQCRGRARGVQRGVGGGITSPGVNLHQTLLPTVLVAEKTKRRSSRYLMT